MSTRLNQLEHAILELGTEMYRLKSQIAGLAEFNDKFLKTMKGLKAVLDEKGLITSEDFDAAVDLTEAVNQMMSRHEIDGDLERTKKVSH